MYSELERSEITRKRHAMISFLDLSVVSFKTYITICGPLNTGINQWRLAYDKYELWTTEFINLIRDILHIQVIYNSGIPVFPIKYASSYPYYLPVFPLFFSSYY